MPVIEFRPSLKRVCLVDSINPFPIRVVQGEAILDPVRATGVWLYATDFVPDEMAPRETKLLPVKTQKHFQFVI